MRPWQVFPDDRESPAASEWWSAIAESIWTLWTAAGEATQNREAAVKRKGRGQAGGKMAVGHVAQRP